MLQWVEVIENVTMGGGDGKVTMGGGGGKCYNGWR